MNTLNVKWFGARGDGKSNDREYIQRAINYATINGGKIYFPKGVYMVDAIPYKSQINESNGVFSIELKDNTEIFGENINQTIIKLFDNQGGLGTYGRIITSNDKNRLKNSSIRNITIDGNRQNQNSNTQYSNILLEGDKNIEVINTHHINCNGNAIMIRGNAKQSKIVSNVNIINNLVIDANYIGIQCSQFNNILIENNTILKTQDNAIDVYGEDGSTSPCSKNFLIINNTCSGGAVGVFCETVKDGNVISNRLYNCKVSGIMVNRINGEPSNINVLMNVISDSANGIIVSGDCQNIEINKNLLKRLRNAAFQLGFNDGNVSGVNISNNQIEKARIWLYIIGKQAAFMNISNNLIKMSGKKVLKSTLRYKVFIQN